MARKKRKKKTSTRRATASKKRRGRPRKTDGRSRAGRLATMSTSELRAELERRQAQGHTLIARRDELVSELRDVEQQLADLGIAGGGGGGSVAAPAKRGPGRPKGSKNKKTKTVKRAGRAGGRKRPKNEMNLVDALHSVLKGKTMGIQEACDAVQKAGYRTTSPNFRTIVNQALITNTDRFEKVARGLYTAK